MHDMNSQTSVGSVIILHILVYIIINTQKFPEEYE